MSNAEEPIPPIVPWERVDSETVLNEPWFTVHKDVIRLPSGALVPDYFVWDSPDIATVAPLTTEGNFVVCEQYRYAVNEVMYQFPAGGIGKEGPQAAAEREMVEEVGYSSLIVGGLELLGTSRAYPTKLTGKHYLFLARNVVKVAEPKDDERELTKIHIVTPRELERLVDSDRFTVADSLALALLVFRKLGLPSPEVR